MLRLLIIAVVFITVAGGVDPYFSPKVSSVVPVAAETSCTVGCKECRLEPNSGVYYWWECQNIQGQTMWIFLGTKCDPNNVPKCP